MTQDKLKKVITAGVSAATVLLVFLLGFLIYQWIAIATLDKKIEKAEAEVEQLQQQRDENEEIAKLFESNFYLNWALEELELLKGKQ